MLVTALLSPRRLSSLTHTSFQAPSSLCVDAQRPSVQGRCSITTLLKRIPFPVSTPPAAPILRHQSFFFLLSRLPFKQASIFRIANGCLISSFDLFPPVDILMSTIPSGQIPKGVFFPFSLSTVTLRCNKSSPLPPYLGTFHAAVAISQVSVYSYFSLCSVPVQ